MKKQDLIINKALAVFCIYFLGFVLGIVLCLKSIDIETVVKTDLNSVISDTGFSYQIFLKPNDIISSNYQDMNKTYISKFVDYIQLKYNFEYLNNQNFKYSLSGKLNVEYTDNTTAVSDPIIVTKDYELIGKKDAIENNFINEVYNVKYSEYIGEAERIQNEINLSTKSYLEIYFKLYNNETQVYEHTVNIPLEDDVFAVTSKSNNKNIKNDSKDQISVDKDKLIIGIFITIISGFLVFKISKKEFYVKNNNEYRKKLYKILKTYGGIIAEMNEPLDTTNIQVRDVKDFDQLLDIEDEIRSPIIYYELKKYEEGCFIIIQGNIGYRYILK